MEVSSQQSPVRDVYPRMRRLSEAIDDPDSSLGQRRRWTEEYVDLTGELVGAIGARAASGAILMDRATTRIDPPDGHAPRVSPRPASSSVDRTDLYL